MSFFDLSSRASVSACSGGVSTAYSQCEALVSGQVISAIETWCEGYCSGAVVFLRSVVSCGDFLYRSSGALVG